MPTFFRALDITRPQKDEWIRSPSHFFIVFHRLIVIYMSFCSLIKLITLKIIISLQAWVTAWSWCRAWRVSTTTPFCRGSSTTSTPPSPRLCLGPRATIGGTRPPASTRDRFPPLPVAMDPPLPVAMAPPLSGTVPPLWLAVHYVMAVTFCFRVSTKVGWTLVLSLIHIWRCRRTG